MVPGVVPPVQPAPHLRPPPGLLRAGRRLRAGDVQGHGDLRHSAVLHQRAYVRPVQRRAGAPLRPRNPRGDAEDERHRGLVPMLRDVRTGLRHEGAGTDAGRGVGLQRGRGLPLLPDMDRRGPRGRGFGLRSKVHLYRRGAARSLAGYGEDLAHVRAPLRADRRGGPGPRCRLRRVDRASDRRDLGIPEHRAVPPDLQRLRQGPQWAVRPVGRLHPLVGGGLPHPRGHAVHQQRPGELALQVGPALRLRDDARRVQAPRFRGPRLHPL